jgi:hypothetical protein
MLEHHLDPAAEVLAAHQILQAPAIENDFPGGWGLQSYHNAAEGRLATPGLSNEANRLSSVHLEIYAS